LAHQPKMVVSSALIGVHPIGLLHKPVATRSLHKGNIMGGADLTELDDPGIFEIVVLKNHFEQRAVGDDHVIHGLDILRNITPVTAEYLARVNNHVDFACAFEHG